MKGRYANLTKAVAETAGRGAFAEPYRILELGVWRADHGLHMIERALGAGRSVEYYGFDLFEARFKALTAAEKAAQISKAEPPLSLAAARAKLARSGAKVVLFEGDTRATLPLVAPTLPCMDLIFIDGGHALDTIRSDWAWASQLMTPKTLAILDDYFPDRSDAGCRELVSALRRDARWSVALLEPVDYFVRSGITTRFASVRRRAQEVATGAGHTQAGQGAQRHERA